MGYSWYGWMSPGQMSLWKLESVLDVPRNLPLQFHQNWVSTSWVIPDIDRNLAKTNATWTNVTVTVDVPRSLPFKFHQNCVSNSWDIADIEFVWWWVGWGGEGKPNQGIIRLRSSWVGVGVLTTLSFCILFKSSRILRLDNALKFILKCFRR